MSKIIKSIRDYYPLWQVRRPSSTSPCHARILTLCAQLVYQSTVFLSRSSITLGLPPLPGKLLSAPAILQGVILTTLAVESAVGIFGDANEGASFAFVFLLISIEGICGGLA